MSSEEIKDEELLKLLQKSIKNKKKKTIEKQKEIYKSTQKFLMEQLIEGERENG